MELIRLNSRHASSLKQLLSRERTVAPFQNFDEQNFCIAIKAEAALQQVFFVQLSAEVSHLKIIGKYRNDSFKAFDALCAICASQTPEIEQHVIEVKAEERYNFWESFKKSRLGSYMISSSEEGDLLRILIKYPI